MEATKGNGKVTATFQSSEGCEKWRLFLSLPMLHSTLPFTCRMSYFHAVQGNVSTMYPSDFCKRWQWTVEGEPCSPRNLFQLNLHPETPRLAPKVEGSQQGKFTVTADIFLWGSHDSKNLSIGRKGKRRSKVGCLRVEKLRAAKKKGQEKIIK